MDDPAYVGVKDGETRAFMREEPDYLDDMANTLAEWIRMGRSVERMPAANALARMKREHDARKNTG